jgi:Caspase domain
MAPYASISIGIDRYQLFQPLNFASADARAMEQFFEQSSSNPEHCLLMTDNSTPINGQSTLPHQQNIQRWLEHFCWETLQPGDPVCFFFSGYGLSSGGQEYLMPIDGDPQNPAQTGIALSYLYRLFSAPGLEAMFFIDANRGVNGSGFGEIAANLAQEFQIPTFLSCQQQEFAHEAMGLQHGIFTAVCLEAMRSQPNLSLDKLQEYLASRVPEISEHHWRPVQNPWAILPNNGRVFRPLFVANAEASGFFVEAELQQRTINRDSGSRLTNESELPNRTPRPIAKSTDSQSAIVPYHPTARKKPRPKSRIMPVSIGFVGTSIAIGVLVANFSKYQSPKSPTAAETNNSTVQSIVPHSSEAVTPPQNSNKFKEFDALDQARQVIIVGDPNSYVWAIAMGQEIPPNSARYQEAQTEIAKWSNEIYQIANAHALKREWQQAIDVAKLVPSRSPMYSAAQGAIRLWEREQTGKPMAAS